MTNSKNLFEENFDNSLNDEVINLDYALNFILRNKKIIGVFSLIFFVFAVLFSLTLKKTWQGQFQIVLSNNNQSSLPSEINRLGIFKEQNSLSTEVGILESSSVLLPVFKFAAEESKNNKFDNMNFTKWKRNLNVQLKRGTSILNITYKDTDKEIIVPVLNEITEIYQKYSSKDKKRKQELTTNYLNNQIILYKEKSSNSLKKAQDFAIDQEFISLETRNDLRSDISAENLSLLIPNIDIENTRVKAANEIRKINAQIKRIEELSSDDEKLQYIGSTIPALVSEGLISELAEIEKKLIEQRVKYREKDPSISRIIQERDLLIKLLKERSIGFLTAQKVDAEARVEASMRPKGVLLKYKELIREASRDESTLISLENQLRIIELESAKLEDPWQLITKPTLLTNPVGYSKKIYGFIGLIFGGIIGLGIAFFKEQYSEIIFEKDYLEKLFLRNISHNFNKFDIQNKSEKFLFFKEFIKKNPKQKKYLIPLGAIQNNNVDDIKASMSDLDEIKIINKFNQLKDCDNDGIKIVLVTPGLINKKEISIFMDYLRLFNIDDFTLITLS